MVERRSSKRTELKSKLLVKRVASGEQQEIDVEVMNVSRTGIGFYCD